MLAGRHTANGSVQGWAPTAAQDVDRHLDFIPGVLQKVFGGTLQPAQVWFNCEMLPIRFQQMRMVRCVCQLKKREMLGDLKIFHTPSIWR